MTEYGVTFTGKDQYTFTQPVSPWAKLPAIARRLGVQPSNEHGSIVVIDAETGETFDVFDTINAFLDRLDAVT